MPVLKGNLFQPSNRETIVLDLGDLARQAAKLREAAERKAADIIDHAQVEAQHKARQVEQQAHQKGFDAGHAEGFAKGQEQGRQQAFADSQQSLSELKAAWDQTIEGFDAERQSLREQAESSVLRLALCIAEKVVHRAVRVEPSRVVDQVRSALDYVLEPTSVKLAIHPEDRPFIEEALPSLLNQAGSGCDITVEDDPTIARGGCILRHPQGVVNATLDTQLIRLAELLIPGTAESGQSWRENSIPPSGCRTGCDSGGGSDSGGGDV
jgi:flagellar assembly protein FliH